VASILLVDDERNVHDLVSRVLHTKTAHTVDAVLSAGVALTRLAARPYDLVLVDLHMPDCDGRELVRRMRAAGHAVPIVILSGLPRDEIEEAAAQLDAVDWVAKPFEVQRLLHVCNKALETPEEPR
jgi:CheY-like chemotaxis protein